MALPQYSTIELIENIKRRCTVPTSQLTLEDSDFCALANDEMQDIVVPLLMSVKSEYFLTFEDLQSDLTGSITIPEAAVGEKLRSVCWLQNSSPLILNNLPRIDLDVVAGVGPVNYNYLTGFYIQGNKLMLYPNNNISTNQTIRLYYFKRTLVLTDSSNFARITSIDTNNLSIVLDGAVPSSWAAGTRLNAVSSTPSFQTTNELMTITSISSPTIFLDNVDGLSIGDYISLEGYSAIPQIPLEAHAYLAQLTAVKCLETVADRPGMEVAQAKANELRQNMLTITTQRVDGSTKKIINPSGGLRTGSGFGRWGNGKGWF
jgi:hypothetical protein